MHPMMVIPRIEARQLHQEMTGRDMVITSGRREPTPGGSSLHPKGRAMDIRIWYFRDTQHIREFARRLRVILGPDFDVVVEGPAATDPKYRNRQPHIHVEYDPKGVHAIIAED
jgi:hypothetical protein